MAIETEQQAEPQTDPQTEPQTEPQAEPQADPQTGEQSSWVPNRTERGFRVQPTRKLETEVQSGERLDYPIRLLDVSEKEAKLSIEKQLHTDERIGLRLTHKELDIEITIPAKVCWCHVKQETWEAGVEFIDASIEADTLEKLALDGIVERRRADRHQVELPAELKTPGDPENKPIVVSDISSDGACIVSPTPIEIGERLLLTVNSQESDEPVSFVAVSRWQKEQGSGYQIGCQIRSAQGASVLKSCGVDKTASDVKILASMKRVSRLTWTVMVLCAACTFAFAYANDILPGDVLAELQKWKIDLSLLGL